MTGEEFISLAAKVSVSTGEAKRTSVTYYGDFYLANDEEKAALEEMRAPFLELETQYLFIDKAEVENLHNAGTMTDQQYDGIKVAINNISGLNYDTLPAQLERYRLVELDSQWEYMP